MESGTQIQGELQTQIMAVLWRIEHGSVEQVRAALPPRYQSAYTTVQTVLNRLATRGLLTREKAGNAIVYSPAFTEAEYLSKTVERTLASASAEARDAVLAQLIGDLSDESMSALKQRAKLIEKRRQDDGP